MITTQYAVSGMTCDHCVNAVSEEVQAVDGVTAVNLQPGGAMVIESDERLPLSAVAEAVSEAGDYTVVEA